MKAVDILAFSETRLMTTDLSTNYNLNGYNLFRCDEIIHRDNGPYHGIAVYHKSAICFENMNYLGMEIVVGNLKILNIVTFMCFLFCPPKKAVLHLYKKVFEKLFDKSSGFQKPTIIMGDFNINLVESTTLVEYVKERYQLRRLINLPRIMELH